MKKIILAGAIIFSCLTTDLFAASFTKEPSIVQNPNEAAPLVAILSFGSSEKVKTEVTINDGEKEWVLPFSNKHDPSKGLIIAGMRADREHTMQVSIIDEKGTKTDYKKKLIYKTPPLPPIGYEFPKINIHKTEPKKMEPGFTILSVRHVIPGRDTWLSPAQKAFGAKWGMLLGLDNEGEVVWYYKTNARIAGVEVLKDNNVLFHLTDFRTVVIDFAGNVIHEWYAGERPQGKPKNPNAIAIKGIISLHHQPFELPNGNFLAMSANARTIKNYPTSDSNPNAPKKDTPVMGDKIIEFDPKGNVVWEWDSFDYLDPFRIGYATFVSYWHVRGFPGHADWTHGNGVAYDPIDDSIIMSFRNQDAFIKIDRKTKEIVWILGNHEGWNKELSKKLLKPIGENFRWTWHGHNPRVSDSGTILVYDNGIFQAHPPKKPAEVDTLFSRGVEYEIDEKNMTVRQKWTSAKSIDEKDAALSWAMGDAHRLPISKNHLVIDAMVTPKLPNISLNDYDLTRRHANDFHSYGRVREFYKDTDELVYSIDLDDPYEAISWQVFGGVRIPSFAQ